MTRVPGWSVIIAMVGGGQEINRGEAGLSEWGRALEAFHADWIVRAAADVLPGAPPRPGGRLFDAWPVAPKVFRDERLHLDMNVRSPRAERLNGWVDAVLELDLDAARRCMPDQREFPIALTRDLDAAKAWLRDRGGMDLRSGLVASADARRLRAWGLDTNSLRTSKGWADWFLRPAGDVRSSFQLEVPATSFDCQGLELDWTAVAWGNDFVFDPRIHKWRTRQFRGTQWMVAGAERARYIANGYRVLLTRARRGQVIWVPKPDGTDATLEPAAFDETAALLEAAGAQLLG
jgi:hypothetical protein